MSLFLRAVAGLVCIAFAVACDSPTATAPSLNPGQPGDNPTPPSQTPLDLSGTYMLTLTASGRCPLEFPAAMQTRTYAATLARMASSVVVTVHSPQNFPGIWNDIGRFTGVFGENDTVVFQQFGIEEWFPAEPLTNFSASGQLTATITADGFAGPLQGDLTGSVLNEGGRGSRVFNCTASDHRAVLSR